MFLTSPYFIPDSPTMRALLAASMRGIDVRSFRLNFELSAAVADDAFASDMERRFLEDLEHSREVTLRGHIRGAWWRQLRDQIARLLSPLL